MVDEALVAAKDPAILAGTELDAAVEVATEPSLTPMTIPDEDLYPCFGNTELREVAYRRYMLTDESLDEIARTLSLPTHTVFRWAALGGWNADREQNELVRVRDHRDKLRLWRAKERARIAQDHVALAGLIRDAANRKLGNPDDLTPGLLKMVAEAAKAGADIEARAVGISDAESAAEADVDKKGAGSKAQPLVVVVPGGGLPPPRNVTIDATN